MKDLAFLPDTELSIVFRSQLKPSTKSFYWAIVIFIVISFISLFYIKMDVTTKTTGIIRPISERTEAKSLLSGVIKNINYTEGSIVQKGSVIAVIQDNETTPKKILNEYEIADKQKIIADLEYLTSLDNTKNAEISKLQSPVYRQQISKYMYQNAEHETRMKKVKRELHVNKMLIQDSVISQKDMFDKEMESEQIEAAFNTFKNEQLSIWQQELAKYRMEISQSLAQQRQILIQSNLYEIRSPISGVIQGINNKYAGGFIQAGESICTISPETTLVAECYVSPQQVGLIKENQEVKYQIDAFDYNYFGILTGKVESVDNDFTILDNKPVFKIHCSFDSKQLYLKNGFNGVLKKGLTFQARLVITNRTLWQLLWDKLDNWFNPTSSKTL